MIFDNHKAVFFHIGKTAGSSIEQFLLPKKRSYKIYDEEVVYGLHNGVMTQHATPEYIVELTKGRIPDITNYFWFTFIRNPWDRMVSSFIYEEYELFDKWLVNISETLREGRFMEGSHYIPQVKYTHDIDGEEMMDFVGRFENLTQDWLLVCDKLGIEQAPLPQINRNELDGGGGDKHYSEFYHPLTVKIVADMYADDIDTFEYVY